MESEVREKAVKGRQISGALERVMRGSVNMEVKNGIRNSTVKVTNPDISNTDFRLILGQLKSNART